jgi:hypothetical protein
MGVERQRQMVAAWAIFWATLAVVGVGGVVLKMAWEMGGPGGFDPQPSVTVGGIAVGAVVLFLVLVGGMWTAWRLDTGHRVRGPQEAPPASHPTWRVAGPGADVAEVVHGEVKVLAHLVGGTVVPEVRRVGGEVRVTGPDGLSGWVAVERLEPLPGAGSGEGSGDG